MITLKSTAHFTWSFGSQFFLETDDGNYIWDDPDYAGDNTIRPFKGSLADFYEQVGIPYGRDKGVHVIEAYCGPDVKILNE